MQILLALPNSTDQPSNKTEELRNLFSSTCARCLDEVDSLSREKGCWESSEPVHNASLVSLVQRTTRTVLSPELNAKHVHVPWPTKMLQTSNTANGRAKVKLLCNLHNECPVWPACAHSKGCTHRWHRHHSHHWHHRHHNHQPHSHWSTGWHTWSRTEDCPWWGCRTWSPPHNEHCHRPHSYCSCPDNVQFKVGHVDYPIPLGKWEHCHLVKWGYEFTVNLINGVRSVLEDANNQDMVCGIANLDLVAPLNAALNALDPGHLIGRVPAAMPLHTINGANMYSLCKCTLSILFTCCGHKLWDPNTYFDALTTTMLVKEGDQALCDITQNTPYDDPAVCPAGCSGCCACTCKDAIGNLINWIKDTWTAFQNWVYDILTWVPEQILGVQVKTPVLDAVKAVFSHFGEEQQQQALLLQQETRFMQNNMTNEAAKNHEDDLLSLVQDGAKSAAQVGWDCG